MARFRCGRCGASIELQQRPADGVVTCHQCGARGQLPPATNPVCRWVEPATGPAFDARKSGTAGPLKVPIWCSSCGATSEAPPRPAGPDTVCPECGKKFCAAERLAAELIAFHGDDIMWCPHCAASYHTRQSGVTCPHCGVAPSEESCEGTLKSLRDDVGDWRKIKRLGELLAQDSPPKETLRFICPFCRSELPSPLAQRDFSRVECPRCHRVDVYVFNGEAFHSPHDCESVLEFRLEKRKRAEEKARQKELAAATKEIATIAHADRGKADGGHVYALLNSAMPGLVKIGKTEREPDDRARELSVATGIPTPFLLAYAEWFKDCSAAEAYVHALLEQGGFRVAQNREFFCAPIKAVIQAIMKAKEREDRPATCHLRPAR